MNIFLIGNAILTLGAGIQMLVNGQYLLAMIQFSLMFNNIIFIFLSLK